MKRIYNLAAALLVTTAVCGQRVYDPSQLPTPFFTEDYTEQLEKLHKEKQDLNAERMNGKAAIDKIYLSHSEYRENLYLGTLNGFTVPLLPDSVATVEYSNTGVIGANSHAVCAIFDPTSQDFVNDDLGVSSNDTYVVDSVHIDALYAVVNPTVQDTLRVIMFVADSTTGSPAYGQLTLVSTAPYPGAPVRGVRFTSNANHGIQAFPSAPNTKVVDRVLTIADTGSAFRFSLAAEMEVTPGNLFGCYIMYIPGQPWTSADIYWEHTGTKATMNSFRGFGTGEDQAANAFFAYDPTSFGSTHTLFSAGRYQNAPSTQTFLNDIIPPSVTSAKYIGFTYTADTVTIGIENNNLNAVVANNFPNPFNTVTNIEYTLKANSNVQLDVTDITGKTVMTLNEGFKNKGTYRLQLNASDFNTGIYYYTISTDSGQTTKKMVVVE